MPAKFLTHFQRFEIKYWISEDQSTALKERMRSFMELDAHCKGFPHDAYPIWSLYLDTFDLACFHERLDGYRYRQKYRLRSYTANKPFEDAMDDPILMEIKKKDNKVILKDRSVLKTRESLELMDPNSGNPFIDQMPAAERKTLERFIFFQNHLSLSPQLGVKYDREAYFGRTDKNVRITFDRNLCAKVCKTLPDLYTESKDWFHFRNPLVILELKVYNAMPHWLVDLIREMQFRSESISKYCNSIEMVLPQYSLQH